MLAAIDPQAVGQSQPVDGCVDASEDLKIAWGHAQQ